MTILYADDDSDDRSFFVEALDEIDPSIRCITACDGREALATLQEITIQPSIIFLDINMPLMNGIECLKEIRKNPVFRSIPIVIYSTTSDGNEILNFYRLGAQYYINKPSNFKQLCKVLKEFISKVRINAHSPEVQKTLKA